MRRCGLPPTASAFLAVLLTACTVVQGVRVEPLTPNAATRQQVTSPVKVHLKDGSTAVFPEGVTLESGLLKGKGTRYDLALKSSQEVTSVPLDEVAAMESYREDVNHAASALLSVVATAATVAAVGLAAIAIFGSCPTVYSDPGAAHGPPARLETEMFPYSIVPLFESRHLARLSGGVGPDGRLRLEIRNEALETHYINQLQLLEVRHRPGEDVLPDPGGGPLVVGARTAPSRASSRAGTDVTRILARSDGDAFRTDRRTLAAAHAGDLEDWVDLTFPAPAAGGKKALVLTARSSLLNTVLFYDLMLADAGPLALDWLGRDLNRISDAVEMGRFCQKYMGLKVAVWTGDTFQEVARVPDPGPIAWHDVVIPLPLTTGDTEVRLRLTFLADAWRIDSTMLADLAPSGTPRVLPVAEVTGPTGLPEPAAKRSLLLPDHDYLRTSPGQRFFVRFDPEPLAPGERRTFLLSSQGYYTEWIRGDWLRSSRPPRVFAPTEAALLEGLARWRREQSSLEARFEKQRVPVF
jgi:hypothetical protein